MVQRLERADETILTEQLSSWSAADLDTLNDLLARLIHDLRTPARAAKSGGQRERSEPAERRRAEGDERDR